MTEENVRAILMSVNGKIPEDKVMVLKNRLLELDDSKADELLCADLHNPTHNIKQI